MTSRYYLAPGTTRDRLSWFAALAGIVFLLAHSTAHADPIPYPLRWSRALPSETGGFLAPAPGGSIYLASTRLVSLEYVLTIRRLARDGRIEWVRRFPGFSAPQIALGSDGGLTVTGYHVEGGPASADERWQILVAHLDDDGKVVARTLLRRPRAEYATAVAVSWGGDVTLAGYSGRLDATLPTDGARMLVIRLDADLKVRWTRLLTAGRDNAIASAVVAEPGGAVVAGTTYPPGYGTGSHRRFLGTKVLAVRLTDRGERVWTQRWLGAAARHPGLQAAHGRDVTVVNRRVYIAAEVGLYSDRHQEDDTDGVILTTSPSGALMPLDAVSSPLADGITSLAADGGHLFFAGNSHEGDRDEPGILLGEAGRSGIKWHATFGGLMSRARDVAVSDGLLALVSSRISARTGEFQGVVLRAYAYE